MGVLHDEGLLTALLAGELGSEGPEAPANGVGDKGKSGCFISLTGEEGAEVELASEPRRPRLNIEYVSVSAEAGCPSGSPSRSSSGRNCC